MVLGGKKGTGNIVVASGQKYDISLKICGENRLTGEFTAHGANSGQKRVSFFDTHRCNSARRPSFLPIFCARQRGANTSHKFLSVGRIFFAFSLDFSFFYL
jgi:hypothetical protein